MNALRQFAVADQVRNLKVLIGNQVARRDQRVCLFAGKIFTLPRNFQMLLGQSLPGLFSIGGLLLFSRETATQPLQFLLSFTVVPWVVNGVSFGVGQKALESNIYTQLRASWNVFNFALGLDAKLAIVAISASNNTHPLNVF